MAGMERKQTSGLLIDIALYAASALISFALLNNVLKKLDPNHEGAKQVRHGTVPGCTCALAATTGCAPHHLHTSRRHKPRRRSWPSGWDGRCWTRTSMKTCVVWTPLRCAVLT